MNTKDCERNPRDRQTAVEDQFATDFSNKLCQKLRHVSKSLHSKTFKKALHKGREIAKNVINFFNFPDFFNIYVVLDTDRYNTYSEVTTDEFSGLWEIQSRIFLCLSSRHINEHLEVSQSHDL